MNVRTWVLGVGLAVLCVACAKGPAGDRIMDPPVIRTQAEASDYLKKAETLSKDILQKASVGDPLSDNEKDNLREAANIFKGVRAFDPTKFGAYFAEGKIRYAIGDYQDAFDLMQQAIVLAPPPKPTPPVEVVRTVAEAHYTSSRCLFFLQRYSESVEAAKLAIALAPNNPDYLTAKASALVEWRDPDPVSMKASEQEAKALVVKALGMDGEHKEANRLAKFLKLR